MFVLGGVKGQQACSMVPEHEGDDCEQLAGGLEKHGKKREAVADAAA